MGVSLRGMSKQGKYNKPIISSTYDETLVEPTSTTSPFQGVHQHPPKGQIPYFYGHFLSFVVQVRPLLSSIF
jgi:hypothetical protein